MCQIHLLLTHGLYPIFCNYGQSMVNLLHALSTQNAYFFSRKIARNGTTRSKGIPCLRLLTPTYCHSTVDKTCLFFLDTSLGFVFTSLSLRIHPPTPSLGWYHSPKPLCALNPQNDYGVSGALSTWTRDSNCRWMVSSICEKFPKKENGAP